MTGGSHAMTDAMIDLDSLRAFYVAAFDAMGVPHAHSTVCADGLLHADRVGVRTHGAASLNRLYLRMLREGAVDRAAVPRIERDAKSTAVVDGGNGLGFVAAEFAMREAIARAGEFGIGAVAVRNSSHCGCMGYYTNLAVSAGMIGIASTNLGTQGVLPPPGGLDRLLGTNVVAAAAPAAAEAPFSLDMSAAVVAAGRIRLARDGGERLPAGWLVDDTGAPVTDPARYFDGTAALQFVGGAPATGGFKGYGLAILADVLCGALSGASVGPNAANLGGAPASGREDADIGHFLLAVDVAAFRPLAEFTTAMDDMLGVLRAARPAAGDPVGYPGLPERTTARDRAEHGVPLPSAVLTELYLVGAELGLLVPRRIEPVQAVESAAMADRP